MCRLTDEMIEGQFDSDEPEREEWLVLFIFLAALVVAGWLLMGCMSISITNYATGTNSKIVNSTTQDKPIRAGVSTTGEAIGEALGAAMGTSALSEGLGAIKEIKAAK
jgi:hypothetical protein